MSPFISETCLNRVPGASRIPSHRKNTKSSAHNRKFASVMVPRYATPYMLGGVDTGFGGETLNTLLDVEAGRRRDGGIVGWVPLGASCRLKPDK
jgi:hypothetical protein